MKTFIKILLWFFFPIIMLGRLVYNLTKEKQGKVKAVLWGVFSSIMAMLVLIIGMVIYGTHPAVMEKTIAYNQQQAIQAQEQQEAQRQVAISLIRNVAIFQNQEEEVLSKGDIVTVYDFYKDWEEYWLWSDTTGWNEDLKSVRTWACSYCELAQKYLENPNNVKVASELKEIRGYFDKACFKVIGNYNITPEELGVSE